MGSSEVVGFTWILAGGHWVNPVSLESLGFALESLGSSGVVGLSFWGTLGLFGVVVFTWVRAGFRCVRSKGSWVHEGSLDSLGIALVFVGLNVGCWVHPD